MSEWMNQLINEWMHFVDIQAKMRRDNLIIIWWDESDDTALQTQDLKIAPCLSWILSTKSSRYKSQNREEIYIFVEAIAGMNHISERHNQYTMAVTPTDYMSWPTEYGYIFWFIYCCLSIRPLCYKKKHRWIVSWFCTPPCLCWIHFIFCPNINLDPLTMISEHLNPS